MWGRFWTNLYPIAVPYPDKPSLDVTDNMKEQNYTVRQMYNISNEFYKSLGLIPLPETFFNLSMLEKPSGREVICHATAWVRTYNQTSFIINNNTIQSLI